MLIPTCVKQLGKGKYSLHKKGKQVINKTSNYNGESFSYSVIILIQINIILYDQLTRCVCLGGKEGRKKKEREKRK